MTGKYKGILILLLIISVITDVRQFLVVCMV